MCFPRRKYAWQLIVAALLSAGGLAAEPYTVGFSTYIGGAMDWDQARDVCVDAKGNVYLTGGVTSADYPTTTGAFQESFDDSGEAVGSGGYCDAFVSKFAPDGTLVWSTYLGGPNYDRGYGIEVDAEGYVYVCGRAGPGFPVTPGAVQTEFKGVDAGIYGQNNGFVAKLKPDGSGLVWATYVGVASLCRDLAIDEAGDVYTHLAHENLTTAGEVDPAWFQNAFQSERGGNMDQGAVKIAADGQSVIWATWLSGAGNEQKEASVRVGADHCPVLLFWTESTDMPTTAGAYDRTHNGGKDSYIVKVAADGQGLVWATYFGGRGDSGGCSTHNLALDEAGNAYALLRTTEEDLPTTPGAFQKNFQGGSGDGLVAKFGHADGQLLASTIIGGSGEEDLDGIYADGDGRVYCSGRSTSVDFPVTPDAWQSDYVGGEGDVVFFVLAADFSKLEYGTFFGGPNYDYGRGSFLAPNGAYYVSGSCNGEGWPTLNAYQDSFAGGGGGHSLCYQGGCYAGDATLVKFVRTERPLPEAQ